MKKEKEAKRRHIDLAPRRPGQCKHCGSMNTFNSWDSDGNKYYDCQNCGCFSSAVR